MTSSAMNSPYINAESSQSLFDRFIAAIYQMNIIYDRIAFCKRAAKTIAKPARMSWAVSSSPVVKALY